MSLYIVCQKKRNNPRMNIRICQNKCSLKDDCQEYLASKNGLSKTEDVAVYPESRVMQIEL